MDMKLQLHAGPATYDELVGFGWSSADARLLLDDPEQLIRTLVDREGWPEQTARSHIENPLLPFDRVAGAGHPPVSLKDSIRQSRAATPSTRR
jgi:hypothetical protein